jgi:hypothetical protein
MMRHTTYDPIVTPNPACNLPGVLRPLLPAAAVDQLCHTPAVAQGARLSVCRYRWDQSLITCLSHVGPLTTPHPPPPTLNHSPQPPKQLLGELLLDGINVRLMMRYVSDVRNLMLMMNLLKDGSRSIQFEAFHVFKVGRAGVLMMGVGFDGGVDWAVSTKIGRH